VDLFTAAIMVDLFAAAMPSRESCGAASVLIFQGAVGERANGVAVILGEART
jgi:hypothetical protein